jgi:predicted regulator of Ras-like GTPase activity (Roadblock/LC7/MglB family)
MIKEILQEILKTSGVLGYVYIDTDKNNIVFELSSDFEGEILGGLGTSLVGLLSDISNSIYMGELEEVIVEMRRGRLIINKFDNRILIIITTKAGNLGTIKYTLNKVIAKLREI